MYFILATFIQCIFHCKTSSAQTNDTSEVAIQPSCIQTSGFISFEVITKTTVFPRLSKSRGRLQIETGDDFNITYVLTTIFVVKKAFCAASRGLAARAQTLYIADVRGVGLSDTYVCFLLRTV